MEYNVAPLNISIFYKAQKVWETIRMSENEQYAELITPHDNTHV